METHRQTVHGIHHVDYIKRGVKNPKRLFLLLHGFLERGQTIYDRLEPIFPEDCEVIAPNGPFPLPSEFPLSLKRKEGEELLKSFAWYFYDAKKDIYYIDYELPSLILKNLVHDLGFEKTPVTIVGYSQGGYLTIFAAEKMNNCDHVIGINCSWRVDKLSEKPSIKVDSLNGDCDVMVDPVMAKQRHEELLKMGAKGSYYSIKNGGHKLDQTFKDKLAEII